jgi:hypothetical protein
MTEHHNSALEVFKKLVIFFFAGGASSAWLCRVESPILI